MKKLFDKMVVAVAAAMVRIKKFWGELGECWKQGVEEEKARQAAKQAAAPSAPEPAAAATAETPKPTFWQKFRVWYKRTADQWQEMTEKEDADRERRGLPPRKGPIGHMWSDVGKGIKRDMGDEGHHLD